MGSDPITDQIPDPPSFDVTIGRGIPSDNTTLVDVLHRYETAGYTGQFGTAVATDGGTAARCFTCGTIAPPETVDVVSLRRLEGASDPDDMIAVVALRCLSCGAHGTLALGYGPDSAPDDAELLLHLGDRRGAEDPHVPADAAPGEVAERTGGAT